MYTIMFKNGKGGVSKTTATENIAAALSLFDYRILVIDIDGQADSTNMFLPEDVPVTGTIGDALMNKIDINQIIKSSNFQNIDIAPSDDRLYIQIKDIENNILIPPHARLKQCLNQLKTNYDFILIDCNPAFDVLAVNAFVVSNLVMIPSQCDSKSQNAVENMVDVINQIKSGYNPSLAYRIFIADKERNKISNELVLHLKEKYGECFMSQMIRHQGKPATLASQNRIPFVFSKQAYGITEDYKLLTHELLHYIKEATKK